MRVLRDVVIPLLSAYALFAGVVAYAWRHPSTPQRERAAGSWLGSVGTTALGGYACFLVIVTVFHVWLAGQRGALLSAVTGGGFLTLGAALPVFLLLSWVERRWSRHV